MNGVRMRAVVEELLECSICMDQFETSGPRTPKMLPCQHSFCLGCIKNFADRTSLRCPSCRKLFLIGVEDLPNTFVLLQLLDLQKSEPKGNKILCQKCKKSSGENVRSYCEDCFDKIVNMELIEAAKLTRRYDAAEEISRAPREDERDVPTSQRRDCPEGVNLVNVLGVRDEPSFYRALPIILIAGIMCFSAGFTFSMFYEMLIGMMSKFLRSVTENAVILLESMIKYIPEVYEIVKIMIFRFFDLIHFAFNFLAEYIPVIFVIIRAFIRFCCNFLINFCVPVIQVIFSTLFKIFSAAFHFCINQLAT